MKVFSGQTNQLLSQIDSSLKAGAVQSTVDQPQGVTKADLAQLDQDQDGQISNAEAPQLDAQELLLFNKALNDGRAATEVVFVREAAAPPGQNNLSAVPSTLSGSAPSSVASKTVSQLLGRPGAFPNPALSPIPAPVPTSSLAPIYRPVAPEVKAKSPSSAVSDPPQGTTKGVAKGTGYYPANNRMEGGFVDKRDTPLRTLQDYLDGKASYVSIALDKNLYKNGQVKYGDTFRIPELEKKYGRKIIFKAVDTGGAFTNKGFGRVDICTRSEKHSLDATVNGKLTLIKTD